jgi:hypothetical protein
MCSIRQQLSLINKPMVPGTLLILETSNQINKCRVTKTDVIKHLKQEMDLADWKSQNNCS